MANEYLLEGFERPGMGYNENQGNGQRKERCFHLDAGSEKGFTMFNEKRSISGSRSMVIRSTAGDANMWIKNTDAADVFRQSDWVDMEGGSWPYDTYTRMRMFVWNPSTQVTTDGGYYDWHIGLYLAKPGTGEQEDQLDDGNDGKAYYSYGALDTECWVQYIVDPHVSYFRSSNDDGGDRIYPYPTSNPGVNIFDSITSLYSKSKKDYTSYPTDVHFDHVEFYTDTDGEDYSYTFNLHGCYKAGTNTFSIGWSKPRDEEPTYKVRYAFSDCHALGWAALTVPTNEDISPPDTGPYQVVIWRNDQIVVGGNAVVYFAIRSNLDAPDTFRQIAVSTDGSLPPTTG